MSDLMEFVYARLEGLRLKAETLQAIASAMPEDQPHAAHYIAAAAATMLREVEAMRRIVDQLRFIEAGTLIVGANHPEYRSALLFAIREIASIWSDHHDYPKFWREELT